MHLGLCGYLLGNQRPWPFQPMTAICNYNDYELNGTICGGVFVYPSCLGGLYRHNRTYVAVVGRAALSFRNTAHNKHFSTLWNFPVKEKCSPACQPPCSCLGLHTTLLTEAVGYLNLNLSLAATAVWTKQQKIAYTEKKQSKCLYSRICQHLRQSLRHRLTLDIYLIFF